MVNHIYVSIQLVLLIMNSTLVTDAVIIGTFCVGQYFYTAQSQKSCGDLYLLHTECKNMCELFQFFQKDRRFDGWIDPNVLCEKFKNLKTEPSRLLPFLFKKSNIFSILNSPINNDDWYIVIRDNLIHNIISFFETLSEYNSTIIPYVSASTSTRIKTHFFSPNEEISTKLNNTIWDNNNKIHFCVIDALCKNMEYVDL